MISEYKDNLGRMDLKPVNGGEASTNNQLLYTGELAILLKLVGNSSPADFTALRDAVKTCHLSNFPGLYSRHPEPYRLRQKFVPVSFDEITGAVFANWCAGDFAANRHILEHAQLTDNRFCDIPGYELMDSNKSIFSGGLKALWQDLKTYYREARSYEKLETGLRKSVFKSPRFYPIFFKHNNTNLFIYNSGANNSSSYFANSVFLISCLIASFKKDNISTKILYWFRFRFLELTGKETFLTKLAKQYYNYTNDNRLGADWEKQLFAAYYPEGHPFHELRAKI